MEGSLDIIKEAADRLAELERKRSLALDASRVIVRKTKSMIHAIHLGDDHARIAVSLEDDVEALLSAIDDEPSVLCSGVVQDTLGEYAEAMIFASVVKDDEMPSFGSLGISPVMGLGTCGQYRRDEEDDPHISGKWRFTESEGTVRTHGCHRRRCARTRYPGCDRTDQKETGYRERRDREDTFRRHERHHTGTIHELKEMGLSPRLFQRLPLGLPLLMTGLR